MLHSMVERTDLGAAPETSGRSGTSLAKYRQFSCEAGRAGRPVFPGLVGFVGLLRNQSVTLATARELFCGNC